MGTRRRDPKNGTETEGTDGRAEGRAGNEMSAVPRHRAAAPISMAARRGEGTVVTLVRWTQSAGCGTFEDRNGKKFFLSARSLLPALRAGRPVRKNDRKGAEHPQN